MNKKIEEITDRIKERSKKSRAEYLERCELMRKKGPKPKL